MAFEQLTQQVRMLGGLRNLVGDTLEPVEEDELRALEAAVEGTLPAALRWWLSTYGGRVAFTEPVAYLDPTEHVGVLLGSFLAPSEIRQVLVDLEGVIPPQRIPFNEDESGNYLVVGLDGVVYEYVHDAPTDRNQRHVASSFEQFVLMLHLEE